MLFRSLWIQIYDGDVEDWIISVEKLLDRYGSSGMFLLFPEMDEKVALYLMDYAEKNWN